MLITEPLQLAIEAFHKFPGIGRKTAQRLALHLIKSTPEDFDKFVSAIKALKERLRFCSICFNITEHEICEICSSIKRNKSIICVVEEASDILAIEKTNEYTGLYHVLGGVLNPLAGVTAENLKISQLLKRLETGDVKEVILALNPNTEGEATSLYLLKNLKKYNVIITRIARGIPIGGELEFADDATIGRAFTGRVVVE